MTVRSVCRRAWRILGSPPILFLGVLLLAVSALSGNVFQKTGRDDLKHDLTASREETAASRRETAAVKHQLDLVKGEQECRSQIASEAELIAGQLQAGIGKLLIAADESNVADRTAAITEIAAATDGLVPALEARQHAVETCTGAKAKPPGQVTTTTTTTTVPTTTPTTSTTRRVRHRSTTTTTRPTSTTGTTTTPTTRPRPRPSTTRPCALPLPVAIPGVDTC